MKRQILIVEIIKGFYSQKDVLLKCKVIEMYKDIDYYKKHIEDEVKSKIKIEEF